MGADVFVTDFNSDQRSIPKELEENDILMKKMDIRLIKLEKLI